MYNMNSFPHVSSSKETFMFIPHIKVGSTYKVNYFNDHMNNLVMNIQVSKNQEYYVIVPCVLEDSIEEGIMTYRRIKKSRKCDIEIISNMHICIAVYKRLESGEYIFVEDIVYSKPRMTA